MDDGQGSTLSQLSVILQISLRKMCYVHFVLNVLYRRRGGGRGDNNQALGLLFWFKYDLGQKYYMHPPSLT